jgi:hypothetical protein
MLGKELALPQNAYSCADRTKKTASAKSEVDSRGTAETRPNLMDADSLYRFYGVAFRVLSEKRVSKYATTTFDYLECISHVLNQDESGLFDWVDQFHPAQIRCSWFPEWDYFEVPTRP